MAPQSAVYYENKSDLGANFVAPDGGWGWLVAIASGLSVLVTYPVLHQFGILFRIKFKNIGISSSELTTIINVQQAAAMCSGFINGPLFRRFSHRQAALIGNFLVFSGLFSAAFSNSFLTYFISISLLFGTGRGIMFSTMTLAVNTYFNTKRQQATAYQYAIAGVGTIILPFIVTFLVTYYGVAGTVLLLSGLSLNNLACSAIYQPVECHVKKVPTDVPLEENNHDNIAVNDVDNAVDENLDSDKPSCDDAYANSELEFINETFTYIGSQQIVTIMDEPIIKIPGKEKSAAEQEALLENLPYILDPGEKPSFFQKIVSIFGLNLLRDLSYINVVMGLTMINIINLNFHYLTPFILTDFGLDSNHIAAAMTAEAICGFVMKFLIALIVARIKCDSKIWLIIGCLGLIVGRTLLVFNKKNIILVLACFSWIGVCSAIVLVFWILVLPSYVPLKILPAAIGLQRFIMGICNLIIGPFIGLIRDATSYSFIIHIMNVIIVIVTISWLSEDLYKKWRQQMETKPKKSLI